MKQQIRVKSNSFEINKLITTTQLFSKIKLSVSARLVLRVIVDYWNYKICCAYPTQKTICKCTGLSEVAVIKAIKELDNIDLIEKVRRNKRIYYYFTLKFLRYLDLLPKVIYVDTLKKFSNIPKQSSGNNILKNNENTLFSNSLLETENDEPEIEEQYLSDEERGIVMAKAMIRGFSKTDNPIFRKKVNELREKYNLWDFDENS